MISSAGSSDPAYGFRAAPARKPSAEELLSLIDTYCDTAPRATARAEEHGSLTLFVADRGWPFYARPRLERTAEPTTAQVREVVARQAKLGVPQSLEWIHETAPTLAGVARDAGLTVHECPLLVFGSPADPLPPGSRAPGSRAPGSPPGESEIRLMDGDDPALGAVNAVLEVAFNAPGTAVGAAGTSDRDQATGAPAGAHRLVFTREALQSGRTVRAGAFAGSAGAVGGGSHNPRGAVSEIRGVGVLPAFRRRGLAGALARVLALHALEHGVTTVFCGAESDEVARVYEAAGFRRIGTIGVAETR